MAPWPHGCEANLHETSDGVDLMLDQEFRGCLAKSLQAIQVIHIFFFQHKMTACPSVIGRLYSQDFTMSGGLALPGLDF